MTNKLQTFHTLKQTTMDGTRKQLRTKSHAPRKNKSKKYVCVAKIGNNPDQTAICVKYRSNDLRKFTDFLSRKHPTWTWFNVFLKETQKQVMSFTKNNIPVGRDG